MSGIQAFLHNVEKDRMFQYFIWSYLFEIDAFLLSEAYAVRVEKEEKKPNPKQCVPMSLKKNFFFETNFCCSNVFLRRYQHYRCYSISEMRNSINIGIFHESVLCTFNNSDLCCVVVKKHSNCFCYFYPHQCRNRFSILSNLSLGLSPLTSHCVFETWP